MRASDGVRSTDELTEFVRARRQHMWANRFTIAALVAWIACVILASMSFQTAGDLACPISVVFAVILDWMQRRKRRAAQATIDALAILRWQVCPHCEYDLRASPDAYRCPECGRGIGGELNMFRWLDELSPGASWQTVEGYRAATTSKPPFQTAPPPPASDTP